MNKEEVSRLKERVKADYQEKLRAIEIVEKMLLEQSPNGVVTQPIQNELSGASVRDKVIESMKLFQPQKRRWTIASLCTQIGDVKRSPVWKEVRRLTDEGRVKEVKKGSGRMPAEYAWLGDSDSVSAEGKS
jgi:hypothetical protein